MNKKEDTLKRVLQIVLDCCAYANDDGSPNITMEMLMSTERIGDNVCMTRCILARQLNLLGYSNESIGRAIGRSESTIRDMLKRGDDLRDTRCAYRIAEDEVEIRVKALKSAIGCV